MISGFCSTGKMMKRRKERPTDECPRCGAPEDVCHVWTCKHKTQDLWSNALNNLSEWMIGNNTHPEIRRAILQGLNKWRENEPIDLSTHPEWLQSLLKKLSKCGWRNFFEGLFVREWSVVMTKQLRKIGSTRSPK
jgi:hypothetical protein